MQYTYKYEESVEPPLLHTKIIKIAMIFYLAKRKSERILIE